MRTCPLRQWLVGLAITGLVLASSGCKSGVSAPSMDWLSWGKKKPSAGTIASTTPQKPSSTSLPSPAATTAMGTQGAGTGNTFTTTTPSYSPAAQGTSGAGNYYTGPYNTGQMAGAPPTSSYPSGGAPSGMAPYGGAAGAPYQSPYAAANNGSYRTADTRGVNAPPGNSAATNPYGGALNGTPQTWNADQYRRDAAGYGAGQIAPAGFGSTTPGSYPPAGNAADPASAARRGQEAAPQSWNTGAGSPAATTPGYGSPAPAGAAAGVSPRAGAYRPGSTARNAGLPTAPATTSGQTPPIPGQSYTGGYGSAAPSTYPPSAPASQSLPYGNYQYPATGQ